MPSRSDDAEAEPEVIGTAWTRAAVVLGARPDVAARHAAELVTRYAEPHRRYHEALHIRAVLRDSGWLAGELGLAPHERELLVLAACAHDVVYDAAPGADERASAAWALERLTSSGVATEGAERVAELVLATMTHDADAGDRVADALLDADLAILAAPAHEYAAYVAAVREEYRTVPQPQWRHGRSDVLTRLLGRREIYRSVPARTRWTDAARTNMIAELRSLAGR